MICLTLTVFASLDFYWPPQQGEPKDQVCQALAFVCQSYKIDPRSAIFCHSVQKGICELLTVSQVCKMLSNWLPWGSAAAEKRGLPWGLPPAF